jgi:hypothetical protein
VRCDEDLSNLSRSFCFSFFSSFLFLCSRVIQQTLFHICILREPVLGAHLSKKRKTIKPMRAHHEDEKQQSTCIICLQPMDTSLTIFTCCRTIIHEVCHTSLVDYSSPSLPKCPNCTKVDPDVLIVESVNEAKQWANVMATFVLGRIQCADAPPEALTHPATMPCTFVGSRADVSQHRLSGCINSAPRLGLRWETFLCLTSPSVSGEVALARTQQLTAEEQDFVEEQVVALRRKQEAVLQVSRDQRQR